MESIKINLFVLLTIFIPIVLLANISLAYNSSDFPYDSNKLRIGFNISSSINIIPEKQNYELSYLFTSLPFNIKDDVNQRVVEIEFNPPATYDNGSIVFKWNNPREKEIKFSVGGVIETRPVLNNISKKIKFPIENLDKELIKYTLSTQTSDISDDISKTASMLAEGEDDLFVVVYKIAIWVSNTLNYDLAFADKTEKSSLVIKEKRGTCDEFSSLFISLVRSLGIPARYVSGIAYSNMPEIGGFGPHAWAEVYFPGYGWIPFDITYEEYGYLDPFHIVLGRYLDASESSSKYIWKGSGVVIKTNKINITANLIDHFGTTKDKISINLRTSPDHLQIGSYGVVYADIVNDWNVYVPLTLYLYGPKELNIEDYKKHVLVKPNEKATVAWLISLSQSLDQSYEYTIPISIVANNKKRDELSFKVSRNGRFMKRDTAEQIIANYETAATKNYLTRVTLKCNPEKKYYYVNDFVNIICNLRNDGNTFLHNIQLCLNKECNETWLAIGQSKELTLTFVAKEIGKREEAVYAKGNNLSMVVPVLYEVLDYPSLNISSIDYPKELNFNEGYKITLRIDRVSYSLPKNVTVELIHDLFSASNYIGDIDEPRIIVINLKSNYLREGNNNLIILLRFSDDKGNNYVVRKTIAIKLNNLTLEQKIISWVYYLDSLFTKYVLSRFLN